ncbi:NH3-dependent NAD+ synthetase [Bradyrhizobium sp. AZCC 2289]
MAKAMLMATLCGSYKTEIAALSKSNLARKILAHVSQAISHDTPSADLRNGVIGSTEALPLRKRFDLHKAPGPRLTGENERKQVSYVFPSGHHWRQNY